MKWTAQIQVAKGEPWTTVTILAETSVEGWDAIVAWKRIFHGYQNYYAAQVFR